MTRRLGFDLLRIWSILAVVAIHTFGAWAVDDDIRETPGWWTGLILQTGSIWAVPVFVMLAGALALRPSSHVAGPRAFLVRRAGRIIPALVVWTAVYLAVRLFVLDEHLSGRQIFQLLADGSVYPHLYFLPLIAGLYLVSPVIAAFVNQGSERRALVLGIVAVAVTAVLWTTDAVYRYLDLGSPLYLQALTMWLPYVGYFVIGYALSRMTPTRRLAIACGVAAIVIGALIIVEVGFPDTFGWLQVLAPPTYPGGLVAVLAICVFVAAIRLFDAVPLGPRATAAVVTLSEATFGVFLVHFLVLLLPYTLLPGFHDHTSMPQTVLAYVVIVVLSFAVSVVGRRIPLLRRIF